MVRLSSLLGWGRKTVGPISQHFHVLVLVGRTCKRTHTTVSKRLGDVDPSGVSNLSWAGSRDLNIGITSWASFRCHYGYLYMYGLLSPNAGFHTLPIQPLTTNCCTNYCNPWAYKLVLAFHLCDNDVSSILHPNIY